MELKNIYLFSKVILLLQQWLSWKAVKLKKKTSFVISNCKGLSIEEFIQ